MAPLWVAKDKKFFDNHGLDVQLILVSGRYLVAQMLASGEIQMTANAPASLVNLIAGGGVVVFLRPEQHLAVFGRDATEPTQTRVKRARGLARRDSAAPPIFRH